MDGGRDGCTCVMYLLSADMFLGIYAHACISYWRYGSEV